MQPINYQIDVGNPFESALKGMQTRTNYDQMLAQRAEAATQQARNNEMQMELSALAKNPNPTAQAYIGALTKYPELAEKFKTVWEPLGEVERKNKIASATQVLSALKAGDGQVAADLLKEQAAAYRNSGQEGLARANEKLAETALSNPKAVMDTGSLMLAEAMGPKEFLNVFSGMAKLPSELQKTEAEAANIGTKIGLENQLGIEKIQDAQLKRKLDVIDGRLKQETNELKREELQAAKDKVLAEAAAKQEERGVSAQNRLDTIANAQKTLDEVMRSPLLQEDSISGPGSVMYKISKNLPISTEAKDLEASVKKLQSKEFLQALDTMKSGGPSGLGALTEKEGERLEISRANLDTAQSYKQFMRELNTLKELMATARERSLQQSGLPTSNKGAGAAVVVKSSPYGQVTEAMINTALRNNPGATRDQIIQFLQSQSMGAR